MKLMPIVWVTDVETSTDFYRRLGGTPIPESASENWVELWMGGARIALHRAETLPDEAQSRVSLCFYAEEPLERIEARLRDAGVDPEEIVEESFGRHLGLRDPDGLRIQIDEHARDFRADTPPDRR